jgi:hypothetical protein
MDVADIPEPTLVAAQIGGSARVLPELLDHSV